MLSTVLKSKLHRAAVTQADLEYEGSITIDSDLMKLSGISCYEKVLVANVTNGNRLETYAIEGDAGSRIICLNGAAAHKGSVGDRVIIMTFAQVTDEELAAHTPNVVKLDESNVPVD